MRVLQGGRVRAAATQPRWRLGWESRGNHVEGSASLGACPQTHLGTEGPLMCISRLQGKEVGVVGGVRTSPPAHPTPTSVLPLPAGPHRCQTGYRPGFLP